MSDPTRTTTPVTPRPRAGPRWLTPEEDSIPDADDDDIDDSLPADLWFRARRPRSRPMTSR